MTDDQTLSDEPDEPGPPDPEDGGGPDVKNDVVAEPSNETDPEAEQDASAPATDAVTER